MTDIQQLIDAVHAVGGTLRADPPDLVIGSPERVPAELKARLRERKPELLRALQAEQSGDPDATAERQHADLKTRPLNHGISIAIDRATGAAFLIFSESDVNAVQGVAAVCDPFEVELTDGQRRELLVGLEYDERLERRNREECE